MNYTATAKRVNNMRAIRNTLLLMLVCLCVYLFPERGVVEIPWGGGGGALVCNRWHVLLGVRDGRREHKTYDPHWHNRSHPTAHHPRERTVRLIYTIRFYGISVACIVCTHLRAAATLAPRPSCSASGTPLCNHSTCVASGLSGPDDTVQLKTARPPELTICTCG